MRCPEMCCYLRQAFFQSEIQLHPVSVGYTAVLLLILHIDMEESVNYLSMCHVFSSELSTLYISFNKSVR